MECSYLLHEAPDGGYALYVNSGAPHQYYAPHDHGTAWAIIAGVRGRERHQLYLRRGADEPGEGPLVKKGEPTTKSLNAKSKLNRSGWVNTKLPGTNMNCSCIQRKWHDSSMWAMITTIPWLTP